MKHYIDPNVYNPHAHDAEGFPCNGAARVRAYPLLAGDASVLSRIPVVTEPGKAPPRSEGSYGGWFTAGGSPIAHPTAYARHGWSNMKYEADTRRVVVGEDWRPWHNARRRVAA